MSKSPLAIARVAVEIGRQALPPYSSKFSPRRFTQAPRFACLVLMPFFRTDYRGLCQFLRDFPELRRVLGLTRVPHDSTLGDAQQRLLRQPCFRA
jgi:hypothetical protein